MRITDERVDKMLGAEEAISAYNDNGARLVDALHDLRDAREAMRDAISELEPHEDADYSDDTGRAKGNYAMNAANILRRALGEIP